MDQWQNGKGKSRYLDYLQLVEQVLERLVVLDQVVLRLCIKFNLHNTPQNKNHRHLSHCTVKRTRTHQCIYTAHLQ
jgi:hypothetical protein